MRLTGERPHSSTSGATCVHVSLAYAIVIGRLPIVPEDGDIVKWHPRMFEARVPAGCVT